MHQVIDQLTVSDQPQRKGLINVNTAPGEVLMCLPNMDQETASQIISYRQSMGVGTSTVSGLDSKAWLAEAIGQKAVGMSELVTVHSYQYSADILAASADGRSFKRFRVVIDASAANATPRIVYRRDLTDRGWPLDPAILDAMRAGEALDSVSTWTR
jgi:hypothetical protein